MGRALYDISTDMAKAFISLEAAEELTPELQEEFDGIGLELLEKVDNVLAFRQDLASIKSDIESGIEVPGAKVEKGEHLRVK